MSRHVAALFAVLAVVCVACAKDLTDLAPFPCAKDTTCPAGLACVAGVGCAAAQLDALCSDGTDCSPAGSGAQCGAGVCATPCADGKGCGAGRVCSAPKGPGVCVADCTKGETCPASLACKDLYYEGLKGCVAGGTSFGACASVEAITACALCSSAAGDYPVACGTGSCALNSTCNGTTCSACTDGFTSTPCPAGGDSQTYCAPSTRATSPACTDVVRYASGFCDCRDGRRLAFDCDTKESCETRCATCDVMAQDCAPGAASKCTIVQPSSTADYATACVTPTGSVKIGQSCNRSGFGNDDCDKGLFCSRYGATSGFACRRFCRADSDCASGEACAQNIGPSPHDGVCVPTCTLFAGGCAGGACYPIEDTDLTHVTAICQSSGSLSAGATCNSNPECGPNLICSGLKCTPLCDASHACPSGCSCSAFNGLPNGGGWCNCDPNRPPSPACQKPSDCGATSGEVCCATLVGDTLCRPTTSASSCQPASSCSTTFGAGCRATDTVRFCSSRSDCREAGYPNCCQMQPYNQPYCVSNTMVTSGVSCF